MTRVHRINGTLNTKSIKIGWLSATLLLPILSGVAHAAVPSFQLSVQSSTVAAGAVPDIDVTLSNPTSSMLIFLRDPVLQVTSSSAISPYVIPQVGRPYDRVNAPANSTVYVFGSSSTWMPLPAFRDFFQPGQYTLQYCVPFNQTYGTLCSNAVTIILQ